MKKYELSLSKKYVSDWGYLQAIREILQNAIDSDSELEVSFKGEDLIITSIDCSIGKDTLILGETGKRDSNLIGQFGEGYKLALLVLLREGYGVSIENGNKLWEPKFEMSKNFGIEVLTIKETELEDGKDLSFIISGSHDIPSLFDNFPILSECLSGKKYSCIKGAPYGEVILDKKHKNNIYVGGLFVESIENLCYGYNLEPQHVTLDRDRRSIDTDELVELIEDIFISSGGGFEELRNIVINGSSKECYDFRYLENSFVSRNKSYIEDFACYVQEEIYEILPDDCKNYVYYNDYNSYSSNLWFQSIILDKEVHLYKVDRAFDANLLNKASDFASNKIKEHKTKTSAKSSFQTMISYVESNSNIKNGLDFINILIDNNISPDIIKIYIENVFIYIVDSWKRYGFKENLESILKHFVPLLDKYISDYELKHSEKEEENDEKQEESVENDEE